MARSGPYSDTKRNGRQLATVKDRREQPRGIKRKRSLQTFRRSARLQEIQQQRQVVPKDLPDLGHNHSYLSSFASKESSFHHASTGLQRLSEPSKPICKSRGRHEPLSSIENVLNPIKRKAVESWIPSPTVYEFDRSSGTTKKRKLDLCLDQSCRHESGRAQSSAIPLTTEALACLQDTGQNQSPVLAKMSFRTAASDDQSQASTPSTVTPDLAAFEQELRRRKIFDADAEEMMDEYPDNWEDIQSILQRDRTSPEPTETQHKGFRRRVINTGNEAAIMASVCPKFLKEQWYDEPGVAWQHDQPWNKCVLLNPEMTPKLSPPKPDQAIGWTSKMFSQLNAEALFTVAAPSGRKKSRSFAAPSENLVWPVFTVEGKGAAGQLRKARRQNMHNGSVMVNNLLELKKKAQAGKVPFGQAIAMSMELTAEVVQLNCHWARLTENEIRYWIRTCGSWSLHCPRLATYRDSKRCITNGVEWIRRTMYDDILKDLSALEELCCSPTIQTPPDSQLVHGHTNRLSLTQQSSSSKTSSEHEQVQASGTADQPKDTSNSRRRKKSPSMQENPRGKVQVRGEVEYATDLK